eukprot:897285-Pyramimonas_sp.AAC.1
MVASSSATTSPPASASTTSGSLAWTTRPRPHSSCDRRVACPLSVRRVCKGAYEFEFDEQWHCPRNCASFPETGAVVSETEEAGGGRRTTGE